MSCEFCDAYQRHVNVEEFIKSRPDLYEEKHDYEITVAIVVRSWVPRLGKKHAGRTVDYRYRGLGFKLKYCPECGQKLGGKNGKVHSL